MALFGNRTTPAPLDGVDVILSDLDGVIYRGPHAIDHAVDALNEYASRGIRLGYITNNASRTDIAVAEQLAGFGLNTTPSDVVTSPQAAVHLLKNHAEPGALVLVIGGEGIVHELEKAGFRATRSADDQPDAVLQGFAPEVGWQHLAEASFALTRDIPWIATNQDWTIPVARGIAPGNGTLVSAVHTAVQKLPIVAGKPETPLFEAAVERFGSTSPIMIGDRLDTDIKGAFRSNMKSVLVLTGIDGPKQLIAAGPDERPDYIVGDLRDLDIPYPVVEVNARPEYVEAKVGSERVVLDGIDLQVKSRGKHKLDLLRAATAAIWNSDKLIYALRVPEYLTQDWSKW